MDSDRLINPNLRQIARTLHPLPFPTRFAVEVTAECNLACSMCHHPNMKRPKGRMPLDLWKRCADQIAASSPETQCWLSFCGEPLLEPELLLKMLDYGKSRGLRSMNINTNGMLLTSELTERILDSGVDLVVFGVDGFSREVFEKLRVKAERDVVYANVEHFLTARQKRRSGPAIQIQFIVMDENEHEVEAFKTYWLERGAGLKVRNKLSWGGTLGTPLQISAEERIPCPWAVTMMHVFWDGRVSRCAGDIEGDEGVGNAWDEPLTVLWERLGTYREKHLQYRFDELPERCRNCKDWMTGAAERIYPPEVTSRRPQAGNNSGPKISVSERTSFTDKREQRIFNALFLCGSGNPEGVRLAIVLNRIHKRWEKILILDDDPSKQGQSILGIEIVGPFSLLQRADPSSCHVANNVAKTTAKRQAARHKIMAYGIPFAPLIDPNIDITGVEFDLDVAVYPNVTFCAKASIGQGSVVFMGAVVGHGCRVGRGCVVAPGAVINARVELAEGVYVGSNASILPDLKIGRWATIGANSAVIQDVPEGSTVMGVPAQVIIPGSKNIQLRMASRSVDSRIESQQSGDGRVPTKPSGMYDDALHQLRMAQEEFMKAHKAQKEPTANERGAAKQRQPDPEDRGFTRM